MPGGGNKKLVVFNLPESVDDRDVEDLFKKFGSLQRASLRTTQAGDTMAFVEFEDARDAEDALDRRHGYDFDGRKLRVEFSNPGGGKGDGKRGDSRGRGRSRGGGGRRGGDSRARQRRRSTPKLRDTWYRAKVANLPASTSWQDLKDFFRKGGFENCKFTDIEGKGEGVGGFATREEVESVIDKLHDAKFAARNGETERVVVTADGGGPSGGRGGGRSRSRGGAKGGRSRSR